MRAAGGKADVMVAVVHVGLRKESKRRSGQFGLAWACLGVKMAGSEIGTCRTSFEALKLRELMGSFEPKEARRGILAD